jgi:hypothetical protein
VPRWPPTGSGPSSTSTHHTLREFFGGGAAHSGRACATIAPVVGPAAPRARVRCALMLRPPCKAALTSSAACPQGATGPGDVGEAVQPVVHPDTCILQASQGGAGRSTHVTCVRASAHVRFGARDGWTNAAPPNHAFRCLFYGRQTTHLCSTTKRSAVSVPIGGGRDCGCAGPLTAAAQPAMRCMQPQRHATNPHPPRSTGKLSPDAIMRLLEHLVSRGEAAPSPPDCMLQV